LTTSLNRHLDYFSDESKASEFLKQGDTPPSKSIAPRELAAYMAVGSLLLNLDEAVTKE